ncbi:Pal1 cell morphology protein-domain-containing protein [Abortiporus biennis]|nr:Pal1 cell morphology protein-domain-containing protein [Abortiporus biennis]
MAVSKQHHRHRSSSDPFSDPTTISYSSYGVPTLAKNAHQSHRPPPPPPKGPPKTAPGRYQSQMAAQVARDTPTDALRDIVTVRHVESNSTNPRAHVSRSQTQVPSASNVQRPVPGPTRRTISQDGATRPNNAADKAKGTSRKPKKGSSHADVIDRLDFSGVGPMFHHDGPFDACAPSRNRHRAKAPMFAWSAANDEDKNALAQAKEIPSNSYQQSPYPSTSVYAPYEPPKKKADAIAEAWGVHEPEPFEDFSAGGGGYAPSGDYGHSAASSRNGTISNGTSRRAKDGAKEKYREYLDDTQPSSGRRGQTRRAALPPPQPIFVPESDVDVNSPPSPTGGAPASPGAPKRTKSLMHRIRKMRDAPNVPVGYEDSPNEHDTSPTSSAENSGGPNAHPYGHSTSRPTHRSQNSFLGRLGRGKEAGSPTSENSDAYVYVDEPATVGRRDKSLPATPARDAEGSGYFDSNAGGYVGSPGGGLGRKTSLLRKMKGVVKGANGR